MFADKLKTLREREGLSQSDLAEKLFVTRQAVSKWERGAGMPDIPSLQKIAAFFGVTIDDLTKDEPLPDLPPIHEPLSEKEETSLHYLWDILLALLFDVIATGFAFSLAFAILEPNLRVFFSILAVLAFLGFIGVPLGFYFYLRKRKSKGYWILDREIEVVSFGLSFIGFILMPFLNGQSFWLAFLFGLLPLLIYFVALAYDIRLFHDAPKFKEDKR
jgi:transcriptional regulator with XRE-family HTH domain